MRCRSFSGCTRGFSATAGWTSPTCLREPIVWDSFAANALLQGGYLAVFGALAYARFATKDVLS